MFKIKLKCLWLVMRAKVIMVTHSTEWDADTAMIKDKAGQVTKLDVKG